MRDSVLLSAMNRFALSLSLIAIVGSSGLLRAAQLPQSQKIDAILAADWKKNNLKGNAPADDSTFVRRIYLDVIGRIPTTRETQEFINSKDADKRAKLIDKLLASEGYVQHFFNMWADILRAQSNGNQTGGITGAAYTNFIKQSLRENKPYDKFVREMIAATGKSWDNGAIGYYMRDRGMPLDNFANTARIFLGTRVECAQCHNHPFDKWTQRQFYEMASFTYGVQTQDYNGGVIAEMREIQRDRITKEMDEKFPLPKQPKQPQFTKNKKTATEADRKEFADQMTAYNADMAKFKTETQQVSLKRREFQNQQGSKRGMQEATRVVQDTLRYTTVSFRDRQPQLPHDYKYPDGSPNQKVQPKTMMGHEAVAVQGETPLDAYARWMTDKNNPRFTTVIVNRLWKKVFGLALIEPLDELMDNTVAMIPEMQTHLEKLMRDMNYDTKSFLRVLLNTKAYQSQVTREEVPAGVVYHFTGPVLRRMSPEQMWDSFVTLINPNPDMINADARAAMDQRVLQAKKTADSMDVMGAEKLLEGFETAAKLFDKGIASTGDISKESSELRRDLRELEKKADKASGTEREELLAKIEPLREKMKELNRTLNSMQSEARKSVADNVMIPAQKKLYEKVTGKPFELAALRTSDGPEKNYGGGDNMMMMTSSGKAVRIMVPGYDKEQKTKEQLQAEAEAAKKVWAEEAQFYGIPEKQWKSYFQTRAEMSRRWLRSAEIESPAPRGHYLREFGQSDRETIENANNEASVPQALAMMNGELLPQILNNFSQLMLSISKAPYEDEKVEMAYMTLLSRKPTANEKRVWLEAQDKGLTTMEDLIYSLINTQQFIFIQ